MSAKAYPAGATFSESFVIGNASREHIFFEGSGPDSATLGLRRAFFRVEKTYVYPTTTYTTYTAKPAKKLGEAASELVSDRRLSHDGGC